MKIKTVARLTIESGVKSWQQVAELVSVVPDRQWRQGSCIPLTGVMRHTNGICFDSSLHEGADINEHIRHVISRFSQDDRKSLAEAKLVSIEFHVAIYSYSDVQPAINLRPNTIALLTSIGSGLDVDTYVLGEKLE